MRWWRIIMPNSCNEHWLLKFLINSFSLTEWPLLILKKTSLSRPELRCELTRTNDRNTVHVVGLELRLRIGFWWIGNFCLVLWQKWIIKIRKINSSDISMKQPVESRKFWFSRVFLFPVFYFSLLQTLPIYSKIAQTHLRHWKSSIYEPTFCKVYLTKSFI